MVSCPDTFLSSLSPGFFFSDLKKNQKNPISVERNEKEKRNATIWVVFFDPWVYGDNFTADDDQQMVGAMALLSSSLSMPSGVVEESCIREHPSPSASPDVANLLAQQHPKRRRVSAVQRRRQRHRLASHRPSRNRRDNSEDDEEEDDEDEEDDDDEDDDRDMDADAEEDAIMDSHREHQQPKQPQPIHPHHQHQLHPQPPPQQQQQQQQQQLYSLRWHDFQSSILSSFRHLRDVEDFVDVTLACDGKSFTAHKMVLSACSPYFRHLLKVRQKRVALWLLDLVRFPVFPVFIST